MSNQTENKQNQPRSAPLNQEPVPRRARPPAVKRWYTAAILTGLVAILTLVLLGLQLGFGLDVWLLLWEKKFWLALALAGLALLWGMLKKQYAPKEKEVSGYGAAENEAAGKPDGRQAPPGEGVLDSTVYVLQSVIPWLLRNRLVRAVALVAVVTVTASGLSHAIYVETARIVAREQDLAETEEDPAPSAPEADKPPADSPPRQEAAPPEPEITPAFLREPDRYYKLPPDEEDRLFYWAGDWAIPPESSPAEIAARLKPMLQEQLWTQRQNLFDEMAPESVRGPVAEASQREANLRDSDDLDHVIGVRMDAFREYPKYRLAKLLANNMQTYAKAYTEIGGNYETIQYYHAQAIFWSWDSLAFASMTPYTLKDDLDYIGMRYHDLAALATRGSEEQLRSSALSDAFLLLANMDFAFGPRPAAAE